MTKAAWQPMTVDEKDEALVAETEVPVLTLEEAVEVLGDIRVLTIEELGKRLRIPNMRWADERQTSASSVEPWCRHAIAGQRPAACPMLANDEDTPGGFCRLNGYSDPAERTPCVPSTALRYACGHSGQGSGQRFDEPPDAEIWRKACREPGRTVASWRRQRGEVEPCGDCWA